MARSTATKSPPACWKPPAPTSRTSVVFQSLSKRDRTCLACASASPPATRRFLARHFFELRNVAAPQVPVPLQHVARRPPMATRRMSRRTAELYSTPSSISPIRSSATVTCYKRPAGGFFLWLDVSEFGGSEVVTQKTLGQKPGVRVVPGAIWRATARRAVQIPARITSASPWCRDAATTGEALHRLVAVLGITVHRAYAHQSDRSLDVVAFVTDRFPRHRATAA